MREIAVLGAGSWGTALAVHLARSGLPVHLWARNASLAERLAAERTNEPYLSGVELPDGLTPTAELAEVADRDLALVVVPSHGFREVLRGYLEKRSPQRPLTVISGTKGIETDTLARMSQVAFEEGLAAECEVRFAVLSGPTFAAELAAGSPSAAVVASRDGLLASELRELFSSALFRIYSSADVVGVELGGAAKNVVAVASGVVSGLGLGHNTVAALITRGLHEMTRLGIACGGQARTFSGLAGLGDLVLTCTGGLSRNRQTGMALAAGKTLDEIQAETTMVAEGIRNSLSLTRLARQKGTEMPIVEQMMGVLYEGTEPRVAVERLMTRELKSESEL